MFKDRKEAGLVLSDHLFDYSKNKNAIIIATTLGGLEIAKSISRELDINYNAKFIKKLGYPENLKLELGAVSVNDFYINHSVVKLYNLSYLDIMEDVIYKQEELIRMHQSILINKNFPIFENKEVIITDDGFNSNNNLNYALKLIKKKNPKKLIVALPVSNSDCVDDFKKQADDVICLLTSKPSYGMKYYYKNLNPLNLKIHKRFF